MLTLPLHGVRVLDLTDGGGTETTARLLADLGADVIRVEPPARARSLYDTTHNANKRSVALDLHDPAGRESFLRLVDSAAIVVTSARPGALADVGCEPEDLMDGRPELVVVSLTDFGRTGPYRDWVATEAVHLALAGLLCRSGLPGREPLLPPGSLASESAAAQAAWAALVAYTNRLETGVGDLVDVSVYEATAKAIDPGYGIGGSAGGGVPAADGPRGRPDARHLYPIFPCADGWVRICVLSPRQWQGMFEWLGSPEEFADPELASLGKRFAAAGRIYPAIGRMFASRTRAQISDEGEKFGVPTAALLTPAEVLECEQYSFVDVEGPLAGPSIRAEGPLAGPSISAEGPLAGLSISAEGPLAGPSIRAAGARVPDGVVTVDGARAGIRRPAPAPGEHTDEVLAGLGPAVPPRAARETARTRPLAGLRVLDLGVIVVGAETGRLFADLGAEVIKVENRAFPDGSRQTFDGSVISPTFAYGHRNKLGLGLDLRSPEGNALFRRLVAESDVVLSNFKPGTMESLGLGYDTLSAINPGVVVAESSAFGATGPWSRKMGYGPLVRAATGLSGLWRYPDDDGSFSDASTIYPDHVAARIEATAVLAKLIQRRRTGRGGTVGMAQCDVILGQLADRLALESVRPGTLVAAGNEGLYRCAGDDEWCVIGLRDDGDRARLAALIGGEQVSAWTAARSPRRATEELQAAGVPAAMMQRVPELIHDPHLVARGFFRTMTHPHIPVAMPTENAPAVFRAVADPPLEPAPLPGEHSRLVLRRVLGMSDHEIDRLVAAGVVDEPAQSRSTA